MAVGEDFQVTDQAVVGEAVTDLPQRDCISYFQLPSPSR